MAAYELRGRVALITGGARGIGFATAQALVQRGASVALIDLDREEVGQAAERLGSGSAIGLAADVTDAAALNACLDELDSAIGLDRLRALHVNDAAAPFGSNRDRHANILEGELGERLGVFLSNPRLQGLPAVLETAGPDNRGPDANEIRKTKELRARWLA